VRAIRSATSRLAIDAMLLLLLLLLLLADQLLMALLHPADDIHNMERARGARRSASSSRLVQSSVIIAVGHLLPHGACWLMMVVSASQSFIDTLCHQLHERLQSPAGAAAACFCAPATMLLLLLLPLQCQLNKSPVQVLLPLLCCCHPGSLVPRIHPCEGGSHG